MKKNRITSGCYGPKTVGTFCAFPLRGAKAANCFGPQSHALVGVEQRAFGALAQIFGGFVVGEGAEASGVSGVFRQSAAKRVYIPVRRVGHSLKHHGRQGVKVGRLPYWWHPYILVKGIVVAFESAA